MINTFRTTFDGATNPIASYNPNRVNVGTLIRQYADAAGSKYLQPQKYDPYNAYVYSFNNAAHYYLDAIPWSDDIDYVFSTNAANFSTGMTIYLHKYSRSTGKYWGEGAIGITPNWGAPAGNIAAQPRAWLYRHTDGTVAVSGLTVTGSGTTFQSSGIAVGARIGFGTTDHTQVNAWYEIAAINSDTSIRLVGDAGTLPPGTAYVIEELRIAFVNVRNSSFDWQGIILIKGLNEFAFTSRLLGVAQATTVDNIRAFYKLDPGTSFFPGFQGGAYHSTLALDEPVSNSQHDCYVLCRGTASSTTTSDQHFGQQLQIMKFNLRAPLSFVAPPTGYTASSTSAFVFKTGMQYANWSLGAFNGVDFQSGTTVLPGGQSMHIATPDHGPTKGQKTIFILTHNRIYACPMSQIYPESQTFLDYEHIYYPPGSKLEYYHFTGNGTYPNWKILFGQGSGFDYYQFVWSQAGDYMLTRQYNVSTLSLEKFGEVAKKHAFPWLYRYTNQFGDPRIGENFSPNDNISWMAYCRGILHTSISTINSLGYHHYMAVPVDCDSEVALKTNQYAIMPKYGTPDCLQYRSVKAYIKNPCDEDSLRMPEGEVRLHYRTSGIDDNTGTWSRVPDNGDLTGVTVSSQIQFAISWEILSITGVVPYVYSLDFVYEDGTTEEHYYPSREKTSVSARMLVFRQRSKWNSAIPNLRIRVYNDYTGFLLLDDTVSASAYGDWAYSTDGYSWSAWNPAADAIGNWIRYTADNLPADTSIRVLLTS